MEKIVVGVITGDVHYNLTTLVTADTAVRMAISTANDLGVPFISNGDLHDQKANIRAECANAIIDTLKLCKVRPILNVGNHSLINEKGKTHALNFLRPYADIVDFPQYIPRIHSYMIPYQSDATELVNTILPAIPLDQLTIMHQGIIGGIPGEYLQDKSALSPKQLEGRRVILSHYHARHRIQCGENGIATYIGNPYSLNFGEANHPDKGYQILYNDGSLEFVPTNLRRHRIVVYGEPLASPILPTDILWVKMTGTASELALVSKATIAKELGITQDFRLDLVTSDLTVSTIVDAHKLSHAEILDSMISSASISADEKERLKALWKTLV